jgi:hypothetical protein
LLRHQNVPEPYTDTTQKVSSMDRLNGGELSSFVILPILDSRDPAQEGAGLPFVFYTSNILTFETLIK